MATSTYTQVLNSLNINNQSNFGEQFLSTEAEKMKYLGEEINKDGIMTDYSILSIVPVTKWFLGRAKMVQDTTDREILEKINPLILDSAYYMGESFVRSTRSLSWRTDIKDNILPKVTGFKFNICMCPLSDTYEMFEDILINRKSLEEVERTILMWLIKV